MKITITFLFFFLFITRITFAQWNNGQSASHVVGQANFTSSSSSASINTLWFPYGVAIDQRNSKIYVADESANRVLRYSYPITTNQQNAELVFGQADFNSSSGNRSLTCAANTLNSPRFVLVVDGNLWISDAENHRVLRFQNAYSINSNGPNADLVLGQSDFVSNAPLRNVGTATINNLYIPDGLFVDLSQNLWVADQNNHRVLRFPNISTIINGANADLVIGQPNFTSRDQGSSASQVSSPSTISSFGNSLFIGEFGNMRILRFDISTGITNGQSAVSVLGQANFSSNSYSCNQNTTGYITGLAIDKNGTLYASDALNNRIMVFKNCESKGNGANADFVLGQPNFTTQIQGTTASKFDGPRGLSLDSDNGKLFVSDRSNSRILEFTSNQSLPVELQSFSAQVSKNIVQLNWETATEINNNGFEVLCKNGENGDWNFLVFLNGANNSNSSKNYSFTHKTCEIGRNYYKLKMIDNDGTFKYSQVIEAVIGVPKEYALLQNFPNPFNPTTKIEYTVPTNGRVKLDVFSITGQTIKTLVDENQEAGYYSVDFSATNNSAGMYFYKLSIDNKNIVKKMMYLK